MYDPERYREKAEIERWKERDPVDRLGARLREQGVTDDEFGAIEATVVAEVDEAVAFAEAAELESVDTLTRWVYSEAAT
jgi:pyruvate dehydrogenase E1 component alpha subunit